MKKPEKKKSGISLRQRASVLALAVFFVTAFWVSDVNTFPHSTGAASNPGRGVDITAVATDAYIYGYPLVLLEYTRRRTPVYNVFFHKRKLTGPEDTEVVRTTNDVLYSTAYLDLTAEPIVLHVPDIPDIPGVQKRYYILQIMDAWTNVFANPSSTNTGTAARDFIIAGPNWRGPLPRPMTVFRSPTNLVWIIGRTQVLGESDLAAVHAIQDGYTLKGLSDWLEQSATVCDLPDLPGLPDDATPSEQVAALTGMQFFEILSCLMRDNPAAPWDMPALKRFEAIGFVPGEEFNPPEEVWDAINAAPELALERIIAHWRMFDDTVGENVNGWSFVLRGLGTYGTDYLTRAAAGWGGLGANLPEDAVYPTIEVEGSGSYRIHFDAGQTPPTDGFWSITLYDGDNHMVVNSWERYAIHNTDPLEYNDDGSLDIYLQTTAPTDPKQFANWLPTPVPPEGELAAPFNLTIRIYAPKKSVLQGKWAPPPVVTADRVP